MNGDGMNGLAVAIFVASLLMFAGAAVFFAWLARKIFRSRGAAVLGGVLGAGLGALAVIATFMESTWSPPLSLTIETDTAHESVILVADPKATTEVKWEGFSAPFFAPHATLKVPRSGVLRLRDLGPIDGGDVEAVRGGVRNNGKAALNTTDGRLVAFTFVPWPGKEKDIGDYDPDGLVALIKSREAE